MIKKKRLMEMMADFSEIWPREITPKLVDLYMSAIQDAKYTEADDVEIAFRHIMATNKFKFPDPASFVEALGGSSKMSLLNLAYWKDV